MLLRTNALQRGEVLSVHGKHEVEMGKVVLGHTPRAHFRQIIATTGGDLSGARIGLLAGVVGQGAGRIDFHESPYFRAIGQTPDNAFGQRRPTDVAHANE